jgi:hypothetical protein
MMNIFLSFMRTSHALRLVYLPGVEARWIVLVAEFAVSDHRVPAVDLRIGLGEQCRVQPALGGHAIRID